MPTFFSTSRNADVRFDEVHPFHLANAAKNFGDTDLFNQAVNYLKAVTLAGADAVKLAGMVAELEAMG